MRLRIWQGLPGLSMLALIMTGAGPTAPGDGLEGVVSQEMIFEHAPFNSCHASTIAETPKGLVAAWFGGSDEGNSDVSIWVSRQRDGQWSAPVEVANGSQEGGKRQPCWNPVLYQSPGGPLLLFIKVGPSPRAWWGMVMTSLDNGQTWTAPRRLPEGILGPIKNKPVLLADGTLLSPSSTEDQGWRAHLERTNDLGQTWTKSDPINDSKTWALIQPTILNHPDGVLQVLCRSRQGQIVESWSKDGGKTWDAPKATTLPNPNSGIDAVTLKDGRHVLIYNHTSKDRSPLNVAISDDGRTWKAGPTLESEPGEYSYPGVIQAADGRVHVIYTWKRKKIKHVILDPKALVPHDLPKDPATAQMSDPEQVDVFVAGQAGYHSFRIPSLLTTSKGTLLAISEGRKGGLGDSGDIDVVLHRSTDGGTTWGPLRVIADDGPNTFGNPCLVVDRDSGTIWMLLTHNLGVDKQRQIVERTSQGTRTVWVVKSVDDGQSWSKPVEITKGVKPENWTWYATGPGVGIQLQSGRLLIPCDHSEAGSPDSFSHVLYSDDHGETWALGGMLNAGSDECQAVELKDHTILINMRNHPPQPGKGRLIATSRDGGLNWSQPVHDHALIEPGCQGSLIRIAESDVLLFSNPASTRRERLTVKLSQDSGKTWPVARVLHPGPSAYSCLAALPKPGMIGCLYEQGEKSPYERIKFARFTLDWLARK
ncbi:MAG: exo-alpha-sialidase [Isosphaeraceae bacterium]